MFARQIPMGRLLLLPIPYAVIIGLLRASEAQAPHLWIGVGWASDLCGMVGATCVALILLQARSRAQLALALAAVVCGVDAGHLLMTPWQEETGLLVGPPLGFLVIRLYRLASPSEETARRHGAASGDVGIFYLPDDPDVSENSEKVPPPLFPVGR